MKERVYTEQEIAAMIERAAELQAEKDRRGTHHAGLTLVELEAVAAEAGLDPSLLRQAAAEMETTRLSPASSLNTTATHVFVERWVPGPLDPDAWEDVVAELRHRHGSSYGAMMGMSNYGEGTTEQIGRSVAWKHTSMSGIETRVLVRPREDQLCIRLSQRVGWGSTVAESGTYGTSLAAIIAMIATAAGNLGALGLVVFLVSLVALFPLIYYADRAWRRKKHRELESLGDRVAMLMMPASERGAAQRLPASVQTSGDALLAQDEAPAQDPVARPRAREAR